MSLLQRSLVFNVIFRSPNDLPHSRNIFQSRSKPIRLSEKMSKKTFRLLSLGINIPIDSFWSKGFEGSCLKSDMRSDTIITPHRQRLKECWNVVTNTVTPQKMLITRRTSRCGRAHSHKHFWDFVMKDFNPFPPPCRQT